MRASVLQRLQPPARDTSHDDDAYDPHQDQNRVIRTLLTLIVQPKIALDVIPTFFVVLDWLCTKATPRGPANALAYTLALARDGIGAKT